MELSNLKFVSPQESAFFDENYQRWIASVVSMLTCYYQKNSGVLKVEPKSIQESIKSSNSYMLFDNESRLVFYSRFLDLFDLLNFSSISVIELGTFIKQPQSNITSADGKKIRLLPFILPKQLCDINNNKNRKLAIATVRD